MKIVSPIEMQNPLARSHMNIDSFDFTVECGNFIEGVVKPTCNKATKFQDFTPSAPQLELLDRSIELIDAEAIALKLKQEEDDKALALKIKQEQDDEKFARQLQEEENKLARKLQEEQEHKIHKERLKNDPIYRERFKQLDSTLVESTHLLGNNLISQEQYNSFWRNFMDAFKSGTTLPVLSSLQPKPTPSFSDHAYSTLYSLFSYITSISFTYVLPRVSVLV